MAAKPSKKKAAKKKPAKKAKGGKAVTNKNQLKQLKKLGYVD